MYLTATDPEVAKRTCQRLNGELAKTNSDTTPIPHPALSISTIRPRTTRTIIASGAARQAAATALKLPHFASALERASEKPQVIAAREVRIVSMFPAQEQTGTQYTKLLGNLPTASQRPSIHRSNLSCDSFDSYFATDRIAA